MTRTFQVLAALVAVTICVDSAEATPNFKITEVYTGVDGEDGTVDWFELTNLGDMAGNIGGLYYDDNSNDPTNDFQLPNFTVDPGEAVIVLIEADASDIPTFYSFWGIAPADVQVGATGGGSLGQGGDTGNVYAGNFSGAPSSTR